MIKNFIPPLAGVLAVITVASGVTGMAEKNFAEEAENIMRISYIGAGNKLHDNYEYYAIGENGAVKIAKSELPEDIVDEAEDVYAASDEESEYWLVELAEYDREKNVKGDGYEKSDLGEDLYLTWFEWTNHTDKPTEEDIEVFQKAAELFYEGDLDDWMWEGSGGKGLEDITVVKNGERYLVTDEKEQTLYRKNGDGALEKIMHCPDGGKFDYCWFRG